MSAEAPPIPAEAHISTADTAPADSQKFNDVFKTGADFSGPQADVAQDTPKKATETKQDAPKGPKGAKTAKQGSDASGEAERQEKQPKDSSKDSKAESKKWEKLGELKQPEKADDVEGGADAGKTGDSSQSTEGDDEPMPDAKAQSRWMQLKAAEKELLSLKPEYESIKKKIEGYEANGNIPEEVKKKLERFEQRYANELLDEDPGFQSDVIAPIEKSWSDIGDVAKNAGLDQTAAQALINAVRDMSGVNRSLAIRRIISKGTVTEDGESVPLPDELVTTLSQLAISAANDLHNTHWPREAQRRMEAVEIANSIRGREVEDTEAQKQEKEAKYSEEAKRISAVIKDKMPLVFEQHPDALEALLAARPSTDVADQVFDAQSGHLVNFMAKTINDLISRNSSLEASLRAREKAKPRSGDGAAPPPKAEGAQISFEEAFGIRR